MLALLLAGLHAHMLQQNCGGILQHMPDCGRTGNLSGLHLHVTAIFDPAFVNNLRNPNDSLSANGSASAVANDMLLPQAKWDGFVMDMFEWLAAHAGFTYTLHTPSGLGADCVNNSGAMPFVGQYKCGQNDVIELNITDVYLGMFCESLHISQPGNLASFCARFLCPFTVDRG